MQGWMDGCRGGGDSDVVEFVDGRPAYSAAPGAPVVQPAQPGQPAQAGQRVVANKPVADGMQSTDRTIAQWLATCNDEGIALARLAAKKAEHKSVREYAEMLIRDHSNGLTQLEHFGAVAVRLDDEANREALTAAKSERGAAPPLQRPTGRTAQRDRHAKCRRHGSSWAELLGSPMRNRRKGRRLREAAWSEKKANEADMAFVGEQCAAHQQMIDTQKVLRQYASPELQAAIDKATQTSESHLERAKQLIHSLASNDRDSKRDSDSKSDDNSNRNQ